jgi:hypothetical protein
MSTSLLSQLEAELTEEVKPSLVAISRPMLVDILDRALANAPDLDPAAVAGVKDLALTASEIAFGLNEVEGVECPMAKLHDEGVSTEGWQSFIMAFSHELLLLDPELANDAILGSPLRPGILRVEE